MNYWKAPLLVSAAWLMIAPAQAHIGADSSAVTAEAHGETSAETDAETNASNVNAASAVIQNQLARFTLSMEDALGMADLPPVEPARLAAAQKLVAPMTQRASIEKLYSNVYSRLFQAMQSMGRPSDRATLLAGFGVPVDQMDRVSQADIKRVTAIINPDAALQQQQYATALRPLVDEIFAVLLPAVQQGMARAYARQFSLEELNQIQSFFATPVGIAFATELLPLQANPEVIMAMLHSTPELIKRIEKIAPTIDANFTALPRPRDARTLDSLTDKEVKEIAAILKVDAKSVKRKIAEDKAAADTAAKEAADSTPYASMSYEAYDRSNWSDAHKAAVEAAEAATQAAQAQADEAQMAAIKDASQRLSSTPKK
jgi:hypothetical protein